MDCYGLHVKGNKDHLEMIMIGQTYVINLLANISRKREKYKNFNLWLKVGKTVSY